ncbi:MAG: DUF4019 domain-containing protein [Verrucomicrobiota bacterium]
MDKTSPLDGLDPADLLKQGVAEDTFVDNENSPFNPPPIEELAPLFPQFEILELIGKGGMGAVYKVRQKDLDRIVALKILPPEIGRSQEFSSRFTREAKALAKLNHPGIVTIHEFGEQDGLYFILMEFVDGVNLAQLMKTGRISPREALAIVPQICDALQFAHDQGIVHRDIKPENILLDRLGRVKVADFGIAKVVASVCDRPAEEEENQRRSQTDATLAGKIIGTPAYMAPEQITHPSDVDHRADIYALGVVFYQMLTGELPDKQIEAPSRKVQIDVRLDEIVLRAMEKDPGLRFQQASVMKTQVDSLGAPETKPEPPPKKSSSPGRMIAIGCSVLALFLILGITGIGTVYWYFMMKTVHQELRQITSEIQHVPESEIASAEQKPNDNAETKNEAVANAAKTWLAGIDAGNYAQSWKDAANFFQKAITETGWSDALTRARSPLGKMKSRKLLDAKSAKSLPGAPDGEYVVMQFETSFAAKEKAVETVTFMKEEDGTWKAAGYFIR